MRARHNSEWNRTPHRGSIAAVRHTIAAFKLTFLFAIVWTLISWPAEGLIPAALSGILLGITFGLVMAFVMGRKHDRAVASLVAKPTPVDYYVSQQRTFTTNLSLDDAAQRTLATVKSMDAKKIQYDVESRLISAVIPASRKTWGERITVRIAPENGSTLVEVHSRPRIPTVVYDSGKSLGHMITIREALRSKE